VSPGGTAAVPEADELDAVAEAYRTAVHEQRVARTSGGHVSVAARARLQDLRQRLRDSLREHEKEPLAHSVRRLRLLAEVDACLHGIQEQEAGTHMSELVRIHKSMSRLRECASPRELIDAAPAEVCRSCGFTRALVSRVRGSLWVPEVLESVEGADPEIQEFVEYVRTAEIGLAHMLLETELVRRRIPVLVEDPSGDPRTYKPLVEVSRSSSYVAAPIMPTDRVIGFFHADRFGQELAVSPQDRDNLWLFAEHFGLLYERAVLVQRLEHQRVKLRETLARATAAVDGLYLADMELARNEEAPDLVPARQGARSRLEALLTAREREVLELMAEGLTNTQIAQALVVSEGTVKSHVKRILRKLHVSNRAEAVARFLHLIAREAR
jgi:LuxR family transcriptional regulator, regulator of acetate metabolism